MTHTPTPAQSTPLVVDPTPGSDPTPATTPTSALGVQAGELRGTRVRFWFAAGGELAKSLNAGIVDFNGTNPWGIWVDAATYQSATELAAQVTETQDNSLLPGVAVVYPEQASGWGKTGVQRVDLRPYIADPEWGWTKRDLEDIPGILLSAYAGGAATLGFPAQPDFRLMFYNQGWAKELGFSAPPSTPEEFTQQACAAAKANLQDASASNDGLGGWIVDTDPLTALSWIYAFGGEITPGTQTETYTFDTTEASAAFSYLKDLFDQGCAWISRNPEPYGYFANRQALFYTGGLKDLPLQAQAAQSAGTSDAWTVIPFPEQGGNAAPLVYGPDYVLLKSDAKTQLASWLLVRWLTEPENQAKWIQAGGGLATRLSALDHLEEYTRQYPQWSQAISWLPDARLAPTQASWVTVRNILQDAFAQVFRSNTTPDQIPAILQELDQTIPVVLQKNP
ncbi:MAG: extracellular solute-binding protein [Chloroflexi bacterium]|nr:extracellular solute-binding protein [Chloroflexota bacterium]